MSNISLAQINLDANIVDIYLSAEELFNPLSADCPITAEFVIICGEATPGNENPEECETQHEPPPEPSPEVGPVGLYEEDCADCCHPVTDKLMNYTSIVVVAFTSPGYTENITHEGTDVSAIVSAALSNGDAVVTYLDPTIHNAGTLSNTRVKTKTDGTQVYELNYNTSLPLNQENIDHLEIVTYTDVDFVEMQNDAGIDLSTSLQGATKQLMGLSATHEVVIESGKVKEDAYIFRDQSTGQVWTGPTHYHPSKGYMGGSSHSILPHPILTREQVPNIKIKDGRTKDNILALDLATAITKDPFDTIDNVNTSSDKQKVVSGFISDAITSRTPDGKTRFLFYTDYANIVKAQSRFPGLKDNNIYQSAPIENIQIYRQPASTTSNNTELGISKTSDARLENQSLEKTLIISSSDQKIYSSTPSMYDSSVLHQSSGGLIRNTLMLDKDFDGVNETEGGLIEEITISNLSDKGLRVFSVQDSEISDITSGQFRYIAEIQVQDPSVVFLNEKLAEMCAVKDSLSDLSADIVGLDGYDSTNNRFTDSYRAKNHDKHTSAVRHTAVQMMDIIKVTTGGRDKDVLNYVLAQTSIQTGSPSGIDTVVEIMNALENKLLSALDGKVSLDNSHDANIEQATDISANSNAYSDMIFIEKDFNTVVDRNISDSVGFDYAGAVAKAFPSMSGQDYDNRVQLELDKFYSGVSGGGVYGKTPSTLTSAQTTALLNSSSDYRYLTPATISVGTTSMTLVGQTSEIDNVDKYADMALRLSQSTDQTSGIPLARQKTIEISQQVLTDLGVSVSLGTTQIDSLQEPDYFNDTRAVFGSSNFNEVDIDETFEDQTLQQDSFKQSVVILTATAILDEANSIGTLNPDSPINQDQEVSALDNASIFSDNLTIDNFDISSSDNILAQTLASTISRIPTGVKAVFLSKDRGRLNWVDHDLDILQDSRIKDVYRFNQGSTVQVEYLSGHKQTGLGRTVAIPQYSPLSKRTVDSIPPGQSILVRLKPQTIKEYGVGTDLATPTPIYAENFIITSKTSTSPGPTTVSSQPGSSYVPGGTISVINTPPRIDLISNYVDKTIDGISFDEPTSIGTAAAVQRF